MEGGIGSRTGRPSSRYGSTPVFTGPVRRWQKQRWTPVQEDNDDGEEIEERPRRRKIRYAPIVVLEGKKKEAEKGDDGVKEVSKTNKSTAQGTSENEDDEKNSLDKVLAAKTKASEKNEDRDLGGAHKVADWVKAAQRGFAH
nr:GrpE protein homolog 2, mitochondrial-like isoform X2 [Tanacetum cinerariifolium]